MIRKKYFAEIEKLIINKKDHIYRKIICAVNRRVYVPKDTLLWLYEKYDLPPWRSTYRAVIFGDDGVGKYSLISATTNNILYTKTLDWNGAATLLKFAKVNVNSKDITDINNINHCHVALALFAINNYKSYEVCKNMIAAFHIKRPEVPIILVGSKLDTRKTSSKKYLSYSDGDRLCRKMGCITYLETSSTTRTNIEGLDYIVIGAILYDDSRSIQKFTYRKSTAVRSTFRCLVQ